jgi:superfamily II DNA/RNA helicase
VLVVSPTAKPLLLRRIVSALDPAAGHKALVFVRRRQLCDELTAEYQHAGLPYVKHVAACFLHHATRESHRNL